MLTPEGYSPMAHHHSGDSFDSYNQTPSPQQTTPDSCVVTLNVGGVKYVTHLSTLIGDHRESLFAEVFRAWPTVMAKYVDQQGCIVFDRDGTIFRHILNFMRNGALTLPDDFCEWQLLKREINYFRIPPLVQLVSTLSNQIEFCLGGEHFRLPRKTLMRFKFFERLLQGETPMTLGDDGLMTLGRDAQMFRKVVTVLQSCDKIAQGDSLPVAPLSSMTPERLTNVYETVFGAGLTGHDLAAACERGMMETRFYTE